ncbi:hypothetical protein EI427_19590 [Flammeovirga pectinis]|uniref:Outer membrane protein beta-barrel domain-containing protein n=1 Tax=Flammeovirga pectinis TaxID=2494373 RepID=A0A3S9P7Z6_9BACT|nr:outer membrane beta-barrel protein [Flammeovirga pectinis]AZQ64335.1 hypothetical protein EI427_19590 [Flammeovirga pectinis]
MKNIKKLFLAALLIVSGLSTASAQDLIGISYNMALPSNSSTITDASFRGGNLEYRHFLNDNLSIGASIGFNYFNQNFGNKTFSSENSAISGETYENSTSLSTLATAHYYLGNLGGIRPYAGVGIGAAGTYFTSQVGGVAVSDQYWGFAVAPEVGVIVPLGDAGVSLLGNVKYNYQTAAQGYDSVAYWGFNIGLAFDF